jgi:hypothetical protein
MCKHNNKYKNWMNLNNKNIFIRNNVTGKNINCTNWQIIFIVADDLSEEKNVACSESRL